MVEYSTHENIKLKRIVPLSYYSALIANDLEDEFLENSMFKRSILVSYVYGVLEEYYLKQMVTADIQRIVWQDFNRNRDIETAVYHILLLLDNVDEKYRVLSKVDFLYRSFKVSNEIYYTRLRVKGDF